MHNLELVLRDVFLGILALVCFGFFVNGPTIFADSADNPGIALGVAGSDRQSGLVRLNSVANLLQKAYSTGNEEKVHSLLDESAGEGALKLLQSLSKAQLKEIGEAFRARKLAYFGNNFARFTYSLRGKKCMESFRCRSDGSWSYYLPRD